MKRKVWKPDFFWKTQGNIVLCTGEFWRFSDYPVKTYYHILPKIAVSKMINGTSQKQTNYLLEKTQIKKAKIHGKRVFFEGNKTRYKRSVHFVFAEYFQLSHLNKLAAGMFCLVILHSDIKFFFNFKQKNDWKNWNSLSPQLRSQNFIITIRNRKVDQSYWKNCRNPTHSFSQRRLMSMVNLKHKIYKDSENFFTQTKQKIAGTVSSDHVPLLFDLLKKMAEIKPRFCIMSTRLPPVLF